jgi:hypothetical protein
MRLRIGAKAISRWGIRLGSRQLAAELPEPFPDLAHALPGFLDDLTERLSV